MNSRVLLLVSVLVFVTTGFTAHDEDDGDPFFKIGKKGEVNFRTDVRIGDLLLKSGKYTLQHQVEGKDHVFVFLNVKSDQSTVIRSKGVFPGEKVSTSGIHAKEEKDRKARVTTIEIAGENLDHTF